jgi:hypothetical protein
MATRKSSLTTLSFNCGAASDTGNLFELQDYPQRDHHVVNITALARGFGVGAQEAVGIKRPHPA